MSPWTCPTCHQKDRSDAARASSSPIDVGPRHRAALETHTCRNPDCGATTLEAIVFRDADVASSDLQTPESLVKKWQLLPATRARAWPDYVPAIVREDYDEACLVETLSPKASAALARRCLRAILADFYSAADASLAAKIDRVERETTEEPALLVLRSIRELASVAGDGAADGVTDVRPGEATLLVEALDVLIAETYVARHERRKRLSRFRAFVTPRIAPPDDADTARGRMRAAIGRYLASMLDRIQVLKQRT